MKKLFMLSAMTVMLLGIAGVYSCDKDRQQNVFGSTDVIDITDISATLSWSAVSGADGYEVMLGTGIAAPTFETSYLATKLTPETAYTWQVRALKGGKIIGTTVGKPFTTTMLVSPFELEVADIHFAGATFSWKASAAAASYKIQIGDSEPVDVAGNRFTVNNLEGNVTYKWKVCAIGANGVSEWAEGVPFSTIHKFVFIHDGFYGDKFQNGTHDTTFQFLEFDPKAPLKEINGWEVYIDLVSTQMDMTKPILDIPEGTYAYSASYEANTVSPDFTFLRPVKEGKMSVVYYVNSGTVKFSGDHKGYTMYMDFILNDGSEFHAYWQGALNIDNPSMYSTFTEDQALGTLPLLGGPRYSHNFLGDGSADAYLAEAMQEGTYIKDGQLLGNGWIVSGVQFHAPLGSGTVIPDGTYTIEDSLSPGHVLAGYYDVAGGLFGVWVRLLENNDVVGYAPVVSGTVTSKYSGGAYNIVIDGMDDANHRITCTLIGGGGTKAAAPLGMTANRNAVHARNSSAAGKDSKTADSKRIMNVGTFK